MPSTRETPRAIQLGAQLRQFRKRADLTQPQLAHAIGRASSHVSRWETGRLTPSEADIGAMAGTLKISATELDALVDLVHAAGDPNWLAPGVDNQMDALIEYESTAQTITEVNALLIPGLLQTHDYALAALLGGGANQAEAKRRAIVRMGRHDVLTSRAVNYHALIGEQALRFGPGDRSLMDAQRRLLLDWGAKPNVTVQAIPSKFGYSPALEGSFVLLRLEPGRSVVQLEHYRSTVTLTDARDVADYRNAAETLRRDAMSPESTSRLIAEITDEMESRT